MIAYSAGQLGLFQETLAYISREGSTLQNASHFLIQNNEKTGEKTKYAPLFTWAIELQLSIASISKKYRIPATVKRRVFSKEWSLPSKISPLCLSPPITGFVITQNSQGLWLVYRGVKSTHVRFWLFEASQCLASKVLMDGSVSQSQGRLQCLIVCIICEACLQNTPDRCVCALGFYALRTHRHTHNGVAALHGVFISEQILSKSLNLSLSIMDHRLEKSFLCRLIVFWRTRGESAEKGATKTRSDAWQAGIALARKF